MAAGDLITGPVQYEWHEFLMGTDTGIVVEYMDGLDSMPEMRTSDEDRFDDHGALGGFDLMQGRTIEGAIKFGHTITDRTAAAAYISGVRQSIARTMTPAQVDKEFVYQRVGEEKRKVWCRPRRRHMRWDNKVAMGLAPMTLQWFAADPRIYNVQDWAVTTTFTPGTNSAEIDHVSFGDFSTPPLITVQGEATDVRVWLDGQEALPDGTNHTGRMVGIAGALDPAYQYKLDARNRTIKKGALYAGALRYPGMRWWHINPGINNIRMTRESTTGSCTVLVQWWDARL